MNKIDDLIRRYNDCSTGDDEADIFIKVRLKMIRGLFEEIKGSEERIFMEEIISKFAEIMNCQQEVIGGLMTEIMAEAGYGPMKHNWISAYGERSPRTTQPFLTADQIPLDPECDPAERELPSYLPPEGGFRTDEQVKKAFTNYLTYHAKRKSGKTFSTHTSYDYSSRVKVLMEIVCQEWQERNGDSRIPLNEQNLHSGAPFLNAYNNLSTLRAYVDRKDRELREISLGLRQPMSPEEAKRNPLNNQRNLGNTTAALAKFEEFKNRIEQQEV
jgi:hypothetical protein